MFLQKIINGLMLSKPMSASFYSRQFTSTCGAFKTRNLRCLAIIFHTECRVKTFCGRFSSTDVGPLSIESEAFIICGLSTFIRYICGISTGITVKRNSDKRQSVLFQPSRGSCSKLISRTRRD